MIYYHAVMLDECGDEFGAGVEAKSRDEAYDKLREMYPENRGIVQLESPDDARERERRMYRRLEAEMDGDFYDDYEEDW